MSSTKNNPSRHSPGDHPESRSKGLSDEVRALIRNARIANKLSLREMATRLGISAGVLTRIETGSKHPTPSLLLKILAELGCESHFGKVIDETPESWMARRLSSEYPDPKHLGAVLKKGREAARITIEQMFVRTGVDCSRLMDFESGYSVPSPGLLVSLVRAWNLPTSELHSIFGFSNASGENFAESFIATILERQGFKVTTHACGSGLDVTLGGGWHFEISVVVRKKTQWQMNPHP